MYACNNVTLKRKKERNISLANERKPIKAYRCLIDVEEGGRFSVLQRVHVPHPVEVPYDAAAIEGGGHCDPVLLGCRDIRHGIEVSIE